MNLSDPNTQRNLSPQKNTAFNVFDITYGFAMSLAVFLPTYALLLNRDGFLIDAAFLTLTSALSLLFTILFLLLVRRITHPNSIFLRLSTLLFSIYYLYLFIVLDYWIYTGHRLDRNFYSESYRESFLTLLKIFGWEVLLFTAVFLCLLGFLYYKSFRKITERFFLQVQKIRLSAFKILPYILLLATIYSPSMLHALVVQNISNISAEKHNTVGAFFPSNYHFTTQSTDNVIILQLESLNSIALRGKAIVEGKEYKDNYMPYLSRVAQNGILFPFFFSTTIRTNRAQASILCGVTNYLKSAYSHMPEKILSDCLPDILGKHGYHTVLYRADNLSFDNTGEFMKSIGIQEAHYKDIMQEGDKKYSWGYDDCALYRRSFEHLSQKFPKKSKVFAYIEVSSNHTNFPDNKPQYSFLRRFSNPENYIEKYLNSALIQDYCVSVFYEEFLKYAPKNTHLFILADNSWPVGIQGTTWNQRGAGTENFLTSLVYIPPRNQKEQYAVGRQVDEIRYSHSDILPTIFSILNDEPYQNSFRFTLRKGNSIKTSLQNTHDRANYEDCQMLVQPYGGGFLAIVKNGKKYTYSFQKKILLVTDLTTDLLEEYPQILERDLSFRDFMERFTCNRYRHKNTTVFKT